MSKTKSRYNDLEYLNTLSKEELERFYYCHPLHHYGLKYSADANRSIEHNINCPCTKYTNVRLNPVDTSIDSKHYCTSLLTTFRSESDIGIRDDGYNEYGLTVCENYPPSFTSKKDQFHKLKDDIIEIRKSKMIMKKMMKDLDKLLDESKPRNDDIDSDDDLFGDDVYGRFISKSLDIKSLNKDLPRTDIRPSKYLIEISKNRKSKKEEEDEEDKNKLCAFGTSAVFQKDNRKIFLDKDLLEFKESLKNKKNEKKPELKSILRPKTALVHSKLGKFK
jgi:hypothetical protein